MTFIPNQYLPPRLRVDPPRNEDRVVVRVKTRPGAYDTTVAAIRFDHTRIDDEGYYLDKKGSREFVIYKSDLPRLEAEAVENEKALAQAQYTYGLKLRRWVAEQTNAKVEEVPDDPALYDERQRAAEKTFPGSVEQELFINTFEQEGPKPFLSVEVVRPLGPPGEEEAAAKAQEAQTQSQLLALIAKSVEVQSQMLSAMNARIEALEKPKKQT